MDAQTVIDVHRVVALSVSLQRGSFNRDGPPPAVVEVKAAIRAADGVIIATPEYNDGIPGVLTTAIDWGSRPPGAAPLTGKPVALMGASPSQIGTARAQLHLRQLLGHVHARTLPPPELLVAAV